MADLNTRSKLPSTPETPSPSKNVQFMTGPTIKKRINDLIIDLHGCIQKWETLNQSSFQSLNSLVNLQTQIKSSEEEYERDSSMIQEECWRAFKVKLIHLRESLIQDHLGDMKVFEAIYTKMKKSLLNLGALSYMNFPSSIAQLTDHLGDRKDTKTVIYNNWTCEDFYYSARSIINEYTKDWLLKQDLSIYFLSQENKEATQSTLNISLWLHQPYVDDSCNLILESMLLEAGIK
eukprot:gene7235-8043_t